MWLQTATLLSLWRDQLLHQSSSEHVASLWNAALAPAESCDHRTKEQSGEAGGAKCAMQAVTRPFSDETAQWWVEYLSQPVSTDPILKPTPALMSPIFASIHHNYLLFILLQAKLQKTRKQTTYIFLQQTFEETSLWQEGFQLHRNWASPLFPFSHICFLFQWL